MAKGAETRWKEKVMKRLKRIPCSLWIKMQHKTYSGLPDVWGCVAGWFVTIELKSLEGEVRPKQWSTIRRIRKARGISIVLDPRGPLEEVAKLLETLVKRTIEHEK